MQFNTIEFLLFFVIFFGVYWALKKRLVMQNVWIVLAGCVFYGWWDWRFLGLILATIVTTWWCGIMTAKSKPRLWTALNIGINVAILVAFKYFDFFKENLQLLFKTFGWNVDWFTVDVLLPVGISFYTFQAIGYSVDVYRGIQKPESSLLSMASFIMFFPQLLAGPIERASQLLPQINSMRRWNYDLAVDGARELLWGLFKKIAIADACGCIVDSALSKPYIPVWKLSIVAVLFMIQIYCDFSGYCNMARGMAGILGFKLSVNFRYPFFSRNVAEFWHRWHITLMNWFRDYVYIPLGGSRHGITRTCVNIMIVFLLSGLWHGASWKFVVWGALWGVLMVGGRLIGQQRYSAASIATSSPIELLKMIGVTYVSILIFVFFRFYDVSTSVNVIAHASGLIMVAMALLWIMLLVCRAIGFAIYRIAAAVMCLLLATVGITLGLGHLFVYLLNSIFPLSIIVMIMIEWYGRAGNHALEQLKGWSRHARWTLYWAIILIIVLSRNTEQSFIYYQF